MNIVWDLPRTGKRSARKDFFRFKQRFSPNDASLSQIKHYFAPPAFPLDSRPQLHPVPGGFLCVSSER